MPIEVLRNIVNISICLIIGIFVFTKNTKHIKNRMFLLFTLTAALWDFVDLMMVSSDTYEQAHAWYSLFPFAMTLSAIMLFGLIITLTNNKRLLKNPLTYIFFILPLILFFLKSLFFNTGIIERPGDVWKVNFQESSYFEEIFGILLYVWFIILAIKYLKKVTDHNVKEVVKFLLIGLIIVLIGVVAMDFLMFFNVSLQSPFIYGLTILSIVTGVGLLKYNSSND
jgi:hypothetical protein